MHRQKTIAQRLLCANLKTPVFTSEKSYPLTFNGSAQTLLRNYRIYGNSIQDGNPTPDNPVEVESVGDYDAETGKYKVPVNVNGTITDIYLDEPLRKVGDYADYVDFKWGKVVRNVNMCNIEQAKGLITSYTKLNVLQISKKEDDIGYMNQSTSLSMLSNLVEYIIKPSGFDDSRLINKIYVAGAGVYFIGLPKSITTKEDAVEYLTHLKLYYRRSTPIVEDITLPALPQFKGTTIYEVQTNTVPSGMEAKYI